MTAREAPESKPGDERAEPQRMCVICRRRFAKRELERYVRGPEGNLIHDAEKTSPGRGWYVCPSEACQARFSKYRPSKRHTGGKK